MVVLGLLLLLMPFPLCGLIVGSNTAFASQSTVTFPVADTNNTMLGFSSFPQTVTLANALTTCSFNAVPSCSSIALSGGTLTLQKDCVIESNQPFLSGGVINGNNYQLNLVSTSSQINLLSSSTALSTVSLITSVNAGSPVTCVDWSYDNAYVAIGTTTGRLLNVYSFDGASLQLRASVTLAAQVNSVRWHPSAYFLAVGINSTVNDVVIYSFNSSTNTLTLTGRADVAGACLSVLWHPAGNYLVASSSSTSKELITYLHSNGVISGAQTIDINPNRTVQRNALVFDPTGATLVVGTSVLSGYNDVMYYGFSGGALTLRTGITVGATITAVDWSLSGAYIAVGLSSGTQKLRIYSASTGLEVTTARVGEASNVLAVEWSPNSQYLIMGRATSTTGTEFRVYQFDNVAGTLSVMQVFDSTANINSVRWSHNGLYIATGDSLNSLTIYRLNGASTNLNTLVLNNVALRYYSDLNVSLPVKFQGDCRVDGNGCKFDLSSGGSIIVDTGAKVILENMTLAGVQGANIACLDYAGTVSLNNVVWNQTANSFFSTGNLAIIGDTVMTGTATFAFTGNRKIIIDSLALWYFDTDLTFQYAPSSAANNLILLTDSTSTLYFNDTNLNISTAGLQLTNGTIKIEGICPIINNGATSAAQGLILGDGLSAANNVILRILAGSGLQVQSGYLVSKDV